MAYTDFPDSGWFGDSILDSITGTNIYDTSDTLKAALYLSSWSTSVDMDSDQGTYGATHWNTNTSAGADITLDTPTLSIPSSGFISFDSDDADFEWTGLDETDCGILIYNDSDSPKRGLVVINFGADKLVSGTLTVGKDATYGWGAFLF